MFISHDSIWARGLQICLNCWGQNIIYADIKTEVGGRFDRFCSCSGLPVSAFLNSILTAAVCGLLIKDGLLEMAMRVYRWLPKVRLAFAGSESFCAAFISQKCHVSCRGLLHIGSVLGTGTFQAMRASQVMRHHLEDILFPSRQSRVVRF